MWTWRTAQRGRPHRSGDLGDVGEEQGLEEPLIGASGDAGDLGEAPRRPCRATSPGATAGIARDIGGEARPRRLLRRRGRSAGPVARVAATVTADPLDQRATPRADGRDADAEPGTASQRPTPTIPARGGSAASSGRARRAGGCRGRRRSSSCQPTSLAESRIDRQGHHAARGRGRRGATCGGREGSPGGPAAPITPARWIEGAAPARGRRRRSGRSPRPGARAAACPEAARIGIARSASRVTFSTPCPPVRWRRPSADVNSSDGRGRAPRLRRAPKPRARYRLARGIPLPEPGGRRPLADLARGPRTATPPRRARRARQDRREGRGWRTASALHGCRRFAQGLHRRRADPRAPLVELVHRREAAVCCRGTR